MKKALKPVAGMRNPMAGSLAHGSNRPQTVRARKGKGSFRRQDKHRGRCFD